MHVLKIELECILHRYVMLLCYVIVLFMFILLYRNARSSFKSYEIRKGGFILNG